MKMAKWPPDLDVRPSTRRYMGRRDIVAGLKGLKQEGAGEEWPGDN
jgi:hypothetical protein